MAEAGPAGGSWRENRPLMSLAGSLLLVRTAGTLIGVGLPLLLIDRFGFTADLGLVLAAQLIPSILFGTAIGDAVASWGARRCAVGSSLTAGAVAPFLTLATQLWQLQLLALVLGLAFSFGQPARMALRSRVMKAGSELSGNGMLVTANRIPALLGPAMAAVLFQAGAVWVFLTATLLSAVSALLLTVLNKGAAEPRSDRAEGRARGAFAKRGAGQLKSVLTYLFATSPRQLAEVMRGDRMLTALTLHALVWMFAIGLSRLLLPAVTLERFPENEGLYGYVVAAVGVGGILGGMCAARLARLGTAQAYVGFSLLDAACWPLAVLLPVGAPGVVGLFLLTGVCESITTVIYYSEVQRRVGEHMNGRYFALIMPLCDLAMFVGTAVSGPLVTQGLVWAVVAVVVMFVLPVLLLSRTFCDPRLWRETPLADKAANAS